MKNSTRRSSSRPIIKDVKGFLFFNTSYQPRHVTVESWEKAGKPADCFVYDGVHQLLAAGIPIVDAIELEGRWIKAPLPAECPDTHYSKHPVLIRKRVRTSTIPLVESEFITSSDATRRKIR
jgi:hypothetical protein